MLHGNILMTPCTVEGRVLIKKDSLSYRCRLLKVILDPSTKGDRDEGFC
jgi:hypothetical protein